MMMKPVRALALALVWPEREVRSLLKRAEHCATVCIQYTVCVQYTVLYSTIQYYTVLYGVQYSALYSVQL